MRQLDRRERQRTPLGVEIRNARLRASLTQSALTHLLSDALNRDLNQGRIAEWEQGSRTPPREVLLALVQVLQLPLDGPASRFLLGL